MIWSSTKTELIIAGIIIATTILAVISAKAVSKEQQMDKPPLKDDIATVSYSKNGITFIYPNNYKITEEEIDENGMFSIRCERKGEDISEIYIMTLTNDIFSVLSMEDVEYACEATLESMQEELKKNVLYKNCIFSKVQKGVLGDWPCYQKKFSLSILGVTTYGVIKEIIFGNGTILMTIAFYENDNYKQTLEQIEQSIKFE